MKSKRSAERRAGISESRGLAKDAQLAQSKAQKELTTLLAAVDAARDAQLRAGYRIGAALSALTRKRILTVSGLSFDEVAARAGYGRSQAFKLVAIAEHFSEDEAVALGYERAYRRTREKQPTPKKRRAKSS